MRVSMRKTFYARTHPSCHRVNISDPDGKLYSPQNRWQDLAILQLQALDQRAGATLQNRLTIE